MKKIFLFLSITLMTVWIAGIFMWKLSSPVLHVFPVLSILACIRCLLYVENSVPHQQGGPTRYRTGNSLMKGQK